MLEQIVTNSKEFDRVKNEYQAIRDVLEEALIQNKSFLPEYELGVKIEKDFQGVPLEIILTTLWNEHYNNLSPEEKLRELGKFTITVRITDINSKSFTEEKIAPTSSIIPNNAGPVNPDSTSLYVANKKIENLTSLANLLKTPNQTGS